MKGNFISPHGHVISSIYTAYTTVILSKNVKSIMLNFRNMSFNISRHLAVFVAVSVNLNPFAPGRRYPRFEASQVVFWSLSCYEELKLTAKSFTDCRLHGILICKILACKVHACTESKISTYRNSSIVFYLLLSLLPSFFPFAGLSCSKHG